MANKVLLKKSSVTSKVPTISDLDYGELAINYTDEKLYFKNASNSIKSFNVTQSTLTIGTGLSGTSYNGSTAVTIAIDTATVVDKTTAQTLTNKSLSDSTTYFIDETDATKKLQFELSSITTATTRTLTIPDVSGTIVTTGDTGTVTSAMISDGTIVNGDISATAAIAITKLAANTISGILLGNNLNTLTISSPLSGTSYNGSSAISIGLASAYGDTQNPYASKTANYFLAAPNGTAGVPTFRAIVAADIPTLNQNTTGSSASCTGNAATVTTVTATNLAGAVTPGTAGNVLTSNGTSWISSAGGMSSSTDDISTNATYYPVFVTTAGGSTAKTSSTNLTFNPSTGTLGATILNSVSDANKKENIHTLTSALDKTLSLRGVSYNLKESKQPSIGLIAQEVEEIIPEVVCTDPEGNKSITYGNIIGLLVEAIKEQQQQIDELKNK